MAFCNAAATQFKAERASLGWLHGGFLKLANLIEGDDQPHPAQIEQILAGSHLSHWRDLPSFVNTSNDGTTTGLIMILTWNPLHNCYGDRVRYGCDFNKEPGKVRLRYLTP